MKPSMSGREARKSPPAESRPAVSRRRVLEAGAAGALAMAFLALGGGRASATPEEAAAVIKELTGGAGLHEGGMSIDLPEVAENGATVPVTVAVDSPMTPDSYVKALHLVAENNPTPHVLSFRFTPAAGKAQASVRIRLAKTQNVVAVAEMSDGTFRTAKKTSKVTIGGC